MRIALGVSYDGSHFHGWQAQQSGIASVQQAIEVALSKVADQPVTTTCAGRTDTGVHALCQVVHFDTSANRPDKAWVRGANAFLPDSVSINWSQVVPDSFDARHSATARRYCYLIYNRKTRSALFPTGLTREHRPLDAANMHVAAQSLLGEQDFSSFRAASCQSRSPMRNVHKVSVRRLGDVVVIDIVANAFLHHMVRNIAGTLIDIGAGVHPPAFVAELLALRNRNKAGVTAPPNGLYLVAVSYPDHDVPVLAPPHLFSPFIDG